VPAVTPPLCTRIPAYTNLILLTIFFSFDSVERKFTAFCGMELHLDEAAVELLTDKYKSGVKA